MADKLVGTVVKVNIHREKDNPVFGESVVGVELTDEGAGEFILLTGTVEGGDIATLRLDPDELFAAAEVARELLAKKYEDADE